MPGKQASTPLSRRRFLGQGLTGASLFACPTIIPSRAIGTERQPGASERLRVAVVGMGDRGRKLIANLPASARVSAICDCAKSRLARTFNPKGKHAKILAPFLASEDAQRVKVYQDVRRLFDQEKLDAVMISTPDHNHAFIALLAMQHGLDVYLEKPLTLTIGEGRALVDAVKRGRRVLQAGSQQRSMEMNQFACEFIRNGGLGKVSHVQVGNFCGPITSPSFREEPVEEGLDWNLFCGPSPLRPYNRHLWVKDQFYVGDLRWRGWDIYRDFSGHLTTNWGAHAFDMVQYALGKDDTGPVLIRPERPDELRKVAEEFKVSTPISPTLGQGREDGRRFWPVTVRYADGVEMRLTPFEGRQRFFGERGELSMVRNEFQANPVELVKDGPDPAVAKKWSGPGQIALGHVQNWLDCIKTRGTPNAPVEVGHRSNSVCLLVNIARELGRELHWDPARERFVSDDEANRLIHRPRRAGFELPEVSSG